MPLMPMVCDQNLIQFGLLRWIGWWKPYWLIVRSLTTRRNCSRHEKHTDKTQA